MARKNAIRMAKRSGMSATETWEMVERITKENAARDGWPKSSLAMTLTDRAYEIRKVYGKRATRFLFEDRA